MAPCAHLPEVYVTRDRWSFSFCQRSCVVPPFGPTKRKDLLHYLKRLGFEGPISGDKHEFLVKGSLVLTIPNSHGSDIGKKLLTKILRQAGVDRKDWKSSNRRMDRERTALVPAPRAHLTRCRAAAHSWMDSSLSN
ncbi:MAG TPA: type II toxin-antitoxin system HicA family toxin [Terriglobia bacterium]